MSCYKLNDTVHVFVVYGSVIANVLGHLYKLYIWHDFIWKKKKKSFRTWGKTLKF